MKKFVALFLAFISCFAFSGCSLWYSVAEDENFVYGYKKNNAFISACFWDGGEKVIQIPEEYNGIKITTLGGYYGRGVPCPFYISLRDRDYDWVGDGGDDYDYQTSVFTVKMGKNITKLQYVSGKNYYGTTVKTEEGEYLYSDTLCKVVYYFEVDEQNPVFYASDGKLYYKDGDTLIEDFYYE